MTADPSKILICDDEESICKLLEHLMTKQGFWVNSVYDGKQALQEVALRQPDVLLLDMKLPGIDGEEVFKAVKELDPSLPVIFITAYADIKGAVTAIRSGASDYLAKPFRHHDVIRAVHKALQERRLLKKMAVLSSQVEDSFNLNKMMGSSQAIFDLVAGVNKVAPSNFSVILQGETGSGKELVARALHHISQRSGKPFVAVDCGAIPENLLESELFGHEKGSFTGAIAQRQGKFTAADKGTIFLDEISNMPLSSQAKLLRVLQDRQVYPVGSNSYSAIDVRVLAATNQDLGQAVTAGTFRSDLFFRLNEFLIQIPPLRKRRQDIPYLAQRFLEITNIELGKTVLDFKQEAMDVLVNYDWPGNVRQLKSTVRRAVLLAEEMIELEHLQLDQQAPPSGEKNNFNFSRPWETGSLKEIIQERTRALEQKILSLTLEYTRGNKAEAARLLRIDYKTIHTKTKHFKLNPKGGAHGSG